MGKVLSAQGSGYFPTCISEDDAPEHFPSGSIKDFMTFYWRVKRFKVTFSGSGVAVNAGDSIEMRGTFDLSLRTTYGYKIESESELVCNLETYSSGTGGELLINGIFYDSLFSSTTHVPEYYKKKQVLWSDVLVIGGISANYFFFSYPVSGWIKVGSYSINFFGGSLSGGPLYSPPSSFSSGSFDMTFEATEYWSYGGTYNTSTGEPL